jgi:hypothetical protein
MKSFTPHTCLFGAWHAHAHASIISFINSIGHSMHATTWSAYMFSKAASFLHHLLPLCAMLSMIDMHAVVWAMTTIVLVTMFLRIDMVTLSCTYKVIIGKRYTITNITSIVIIIIVVINNIIIITWCRFDFCMAPAQIRDSRMAAALLHFAARYSNGMPATLDIALPDQVPVTAEELRQIEATHQVCQCRWQCSVKYCWSQKHGVYRITIR